MPAGASPSEGGSLAPRNAGYSLWEIGEGTRDVRLAIAILCATAAATILGCSDFDRLRVRAYLGGPDSQILVGHAYETGEGVGKDPVTAVEWYRKAAEQGHPKAFGLLGEKYYLGVGVRRDLVRANMFFTLGLRRGEAVLGEYVRAVEAELSDEEIAESRRLADAWDANH
jgi:TPR repeat protein